MPASSQIDFLDAQVTDFSSDACCFMMLSSDELAITDLIKFSCLFLVLFVRSLALQVQTRDRVICVRMIGCPPVLTAIVLLSVSFHKLLIKCAFSPISSSVRGVLDAVFSEKIIYLV